jgi:hypothetical protein
VGSLLRLTLCGGPLWRRKSSRTESAQGVWHQWQRHTGAVVVKMGVEVSAEVGAEVGTKVDVLLAIGVMHGWVGGPVASDLGGGWVASTASGGASWEP